MGAFVNLKRNAEAIPELCFDPEKNNGQATVCFPGPRRPKASDGRVRCETTSRSVSGRFALFSRKTSGCERVFVYLKMDSEDCGRPYRPDLRRWRNWTLIRPSSGNSFLVHYETLCIRAFRLVHDRNLSEDIVQDVFLMLWKRRTEIDFSRPVLPYLTTAVRNRSIDCLRSRKSRGEGTCGLDTLDGYVRCLVADRCEEEFDLSWLRHEIDDGVSQLSEQCRRVFFAEQGDRIEEPRDRRAAQHQCQGRGEAHRRGPVEAAAQAEPQRLLSTCFSDRVFFSEDPPPIPVASHEARARPCGRALAFFRRSERSALFQRELVRVRHRTFRPVDAGRDLTVADVAFEQALVVVYQHRKTYLVVGRMERNSGACVPTASRRCPHRSGSAETALRDGCCRARCRSRGGMCSSTMRAEALRNSSEATVSRSQAASSSR